MDKEYIINEIIRTAKANGDKPLGQQRFLRETGIKKNDWYGKIWVRWGDAIREAGFAPNPLQTAYNVSILFDHYIRLTRELGRLPTDGDMLLKAKTDSTFPSTSTFNLRFGSKSGIIKQLVKYCQQSEKYKDIILLCDKYTPPKKNAIDEKQKYSQYKIGFVYLLQHGSRHEYKIGKTFNPIRREGEIALQLPEKLEPIHYIETDDPSGIEAYWHNRFKDKKKQGEWFELSSSDVKAFKKWKKIA